MSEEYIYLFNEIEADFYHYMVTDGNLKAKTSRDYISRLRFLAGYYRLDNSLTMEKIQDILVKETERMQDRVVYNTSHAIGDFSAGLSKLLNFYRSGYINQIIRNEEAEEEHVKRDTSLSNTERIAIIKARIGQGLFRQNLIDYWRGCAVSGCHKTEVMVASHIKPWRDASNAERIDIFNGLLLLPNMDKLFDKGYMTFDCLGMAHFSSLLSDEDIALMGIDKRRCHLVKIDERHKSFLKYHNEHCFIG